MKAIVVFHEGNFPAETREHLSEFFDFLNASWQEEPDLCRIDLAIESRHNTIGPTPLPRFDDPDRSLDELLDLSVEVFEFVSDRFNDWNAMQPEI